MYSDGPYLWRELALRRYDPVRETDGMDWKYIYQSRIWAEMILQRDDITAFLQEKLAEDEDRPAWKISGQILLATIRDMIVENGIYNFRILLISKILRMQTTSCLILWLIAYGAKRTIVSSRPWFKSSFRPYPSSTHNFQEVCSLLHKGLCTFQTRTPFLALIGPQTFWLSCQLSSSSNII